MFTGLALAVALAVVVAAILHVELQPRQQPQRGAVAGTPAPSSGSLPKGTKPGEPVAQRLIPGTLVIPKINVRAVIEQVTVDSNDDMAAPRKPSDVGWYSPGVAPGQSGDAVIDGHLDWYGVPKAVFYYLYELRVGDQIEVVSQGGQQLDFKVTDSTNVSRNAHVAGLFANTGAPRLTLITCSGDWNPSISQYNQRLLVDAVFTGVAS